MSQSSSSGSAEKRKRTDEQTDGKSAKRSRPDGKDTKRSSAAQGNDEEEEVYEEVAPQSSASTSLVTGLRDMEVDSGSGSCSLPAQHSGSDSCPQPAQLHGWMMDPKRTLEEWKEMEHKVKVMGQKVMARRLRPGTLVEWSDKQDWLQVQRGIPRVTHLGMVSDTHPIRTWVYRVSDSSDSTRLLPAPEFEQVKTQRLELVERVPRLKSLPFPTQSSWSLTFDLGYAPGDQVLARTTEKKLQSAYLVEARSEKRAIVQWLLPEHLSADEDWCERKSVGFYVRMHVSDIRNKIDEWLGTFKKTPDKCPMIPVLWQLVCSYLECSVCQHLACPGNCAASIAFHRAPYTYDSHTMAILQQLRPPQQSATSVAPPTDTIAPMEDEEDDLF
jgi:hypothetical protein